MPLVKTTYDLPPDAPRSVLREDGIEYGFIGTLQGLKYEYRPGIAKRPAPQ
jgi:type I restriction enzyme R subunit